MNSYIHVSGYVCFHIVISQPCGCVITIWKQTWHCWVFIVWLCSRIHEIHKSHNAPVPYPTMHHFVTEMWTWGTQDVFFFKKKGVVYQNEFTYLVSFNGHQFIGHVTFSGWLVSGVFLGVFADKISQHDCHPLHCKTAREMILNELMSILYDGLKLWYTCILMWLHIRTSIIKRCSCG